MSKNNTTTEPSTKIAIFKGKEIRKTIHNDEWWFSVIDVIEALVVSRKCFIKLLPIYPAPPVTNIFIYYLYRIFVKFCFLSPSLVLILILFS